MSKRGSVIVLVGSVGVLALVLALLHKFEQDADYHKFVDIRRLPSDDPKRFGVTNCLNVISNLPFLVVGLWGVRRVEPRIRAARTRAALVETLPELLFAVGVALTAFGSSLYHLGPGDGPLVWDRLPMTIAFTALTAGIVDDYFLPGVHRFVVPLVIAGAGTVFYWYPGGGGLGPYYFVQFVPLVVVLVILCTVCPLGTRELGLTIALLLYAIAKLCEACDARLYEVSKGLVSGHTLKHLAAAGASAVVIASIRIHSAKRAH